MMKRILIVVTLAVGAPVFIFAKQFMDLKFTGFYSQIGHVPLYFKTSENLAAGACANMQDTVKRGSATNVGNICEVTCRRTMNPDWFITLVAVKKIKIHENKMKTEFVTVPMEEEWDKVFFCGWNPERGVSDKDIGQAGIDTLEDVAIANMMCKKGTDKNIIYLIGAASYDQCLSDCKKCPIPANWKD